MIRGSAFKGIIKYHNESEKSEMRFDKSFSASLNLTISSCVNVFGFPFPSIPSILWYNHELDLPKYLLDRSAHEIEFANSNRKSSCLIVVVFFSIYVNVSRSFIKSSKEPAPIIGSGRT